MEEGGGIYINQLGSHNYCSGSGCFYEIEGVSFDELMNNTVNITLDFSDNTASKGGLDIYGVTPNSIGIPLDWGQREKLLVVLSKIWYSNLLKPIIIKRVCLCDSSSQLMCANLSHIFYNTTRYPGEVFPLYVAHVGFDFGTVTGHVYVIASIVYLHCCSFAVFHRFAFIISFY